MSFPKIDVPTYDLELPSGKKVKFRPFLVKEHKILLMNQNGDKEDIEKIVLSLVDSCTFNQLNVNTLTGVDVEYLYMNIRARSISELFDLIIVCSGCGENIDATANILDLKITKNPDHKTKILVTNTVGVEMQYPKLGEMIDVFANRDDPSKIFDMVQNSIKAIYTPEEYTEIDANNKEQLNEWLEGLTKEQFEKIEEFFVTMPNIVQELDKECPACNTLNHVEIKGLENFFV